MLEVPMNQDLNKRERAAIQFPNLSDARMHLCEIRDSMRALTRVMENFIAHRCSCRLPPSFPNSCVHR
jgi:hypothetical protein